MSTNVADNIARVWGDRLEKLALEVDHVGTGWALFSEARVREIMHQSRVAEGWASYFGRQALADFSAMITANVICPDCQGFPATPGALVCSRCSGAGHIPSRKA